jgi:hypothetical protein
MPWATIQQVTDQTGKTVSEEHLALASSIIDTYAGTDPEMPATALSTRDRAILRKATAWQAVWIGSQPGYLEHRGVDYSPSADGTSADRRSQADQDLAPLAQRELKNLSWVGTRVVNVRGGRTHVKGALMIDFMNESSDGGYGPGYPGGGSSGGTGLSDWQEITGKPLTFPPDPHAHEMSDVIGLAEALAAAGTGDGGTISLAWSEITGKPATFPPASHTHAWASITDKPTTYPPAAHSHAVGDVSGLQAQLDSKATAAYAAELGDRVSELEDAPAGGGGSTVQVFSDYIKTGDVPVAEHGTWAAVEGAQWSVPAAVGAKLNTTVRLLLDVGNQAACLFDLAVIGAGATIVRVASSGDATTTAEGDPALYPSTNVRFRGSETGMDFVAEAGDISGGNVTFGFIHKGGTGKVYASPEYPLRWSATVVS